jgi:hypothetical protein
MRGLYRRLHMRFGEEQMNIMDERRNFMFCRIRFNEEK